MLVPIPANDGAVNQYNLGQSCSATPRIYYVNGVRTVPREHAATAALMSLLVEHPVWGVYNATSGVEWYKAGHDFMQCILEVIQNATARPFSPGKQGKPGKISEAEIPAFLNDLEKKYIIWNQATASLFRELVKNRHEEQKIIAHSQGNLITSNALFIVEDVLGSAALQKIRVYSLASPAPAWPIGLRHTHGGGGRQENAYMNDVVALFRPHNLAAKLGYQGLQNAGDFRNHDGFGPVGTGPHDIGEIVHTLNFLKSIRGDLGLSAEFPADFFEKNRKLAQAALPLEAVAP